MRRLWQRFVCWLAHEDYIDDLDVAAMCEGLVTINICPHCGGVQNVDVWEWD